MSSLNKSSIGRGTVIGSGSRTPRATGEALSLSELPRKPASAQRSSDPYNSSGSFDRTKNWARVGKR